MSIGHGLNLEWNAMQIISAWTVQSILNSQLNYMLYVSLKSSTKTNSLIVKNQPKADAAVQINGYSNRAFKKELAHEENYSVKFGAGGTNFSAHSINSK